MRIHQRFSGDEILDLAQYQMMPVHNPLYKASCL
jgi:hypothetical protein